MFSKTVPSKRLWVLKRIVPLTLFLTGAVKSSPSGMLTWPSHLTAGRPLIEKERSVPGPVTCTRSVDSMMLLSGSMAFDIRG